MLNEIEGYIIDLDGTIYRGNQAIDGAMEAIDHLKKHGKRLFI